MHITPHPLHSLSEIRLDPHQPGGSQYSSRGVLTCTPPASVEGSTPTWTEGTPSLTESSSSGEMGIQNERTRH